MAAYQYQQPRGNPYAGSIADLLSQQGDIRARQALTIGETQARAAQTQGDVWGRAISGIGQTLGAIPQQIQEQKTQALTTRLNTLRVNEAERTVASTAALESALKNPENRKADGAIDDLKVSQELQLKNFGAWQQYQTIAQANAQNALNMRNTALDISKKVLDQAKQARELEDLQRRSIGELAYHTEQEMKKAGANPLLLRDTFASGVAVGAKDGFFDEDTAKRVLMQTAQAGPDDLIGLVSRLVPVDQRAALDKAAAEQRKTIAEATKAEAEAKAIQQFGTTTPPSLQSENVLLDGRPAKVNFHPKTGQYLLPDGTDVSARVKPIPPASAVNLLNPDDTQALAGMVRTGNLQLSDLAKRGNYNQIIAMANRDHVKETGKPLNLTQMRRDQEAARKWVQSMNAPQMIRFQGLASSVVNTMDEVKQLGEELRQGGIQKWNSVKRSTIQQVYGNTPQSELAARYVGAVNTLKEEFANLANGGYAPTEAAWALANQQINADFGFKDLNASLSEVQRLINYRVQGLMNVQPVLFQGGGAPSAAPAPTPTPSAGPKTIEAIDPQGNVHHAPAGTPLPAGWKLKP